MNPQDAASTSIGNNYLSWQRHAYKTVECKHDYADTASFWSDCENKSLDDDQRNKQKQSETNHKGHCNSV